MQRRGWRPERVACRPRVVAAIAGSVAGMASELLRSPLHDRHVAAGARFGAFGGWEMPLTYSGPSGGTVAEHQSVRSEVGVFDVSHLGKARVTGPGSRDFLNTAFTADLAKVEPGFAQYTMCCTESGGVVDDLIAYVYGDDDVFLVPNAANTAEIVRLLSAAAPAGIGVVNQHREYAVLAVQGPRSPEVMESLGLPAAHPYMSHQMVQWQGRPVIVCRSGYTGERGYELLPLASDAGPLWDAIVSAGAVPCGLGARDTLRTEMGYPLHGQDLSAEISPVGRPPGLGCRLEEGRLLGTRGAGGRACRPQAPALGAPGLRRYRAAGDGRLRWLGWHHRNGDERHLQPDAGCRNRARPAVRGIRGRRRVH